MIIVSAFFLNSYFPSLAMILRNYYHTQLLSFTCFLPFSTAIEQYLHLADTRKTLSPVAICLKAGHKFVKVSLYYSLPGIKRSYSSETILDWLLSFRKQHQGNLCNSLHTSSYLPLVSSYIYIPTICHTRNSKCFAFVSSKNF